MICIAAPDCTTRTHYEDTRVVVETRLKSYTAMRFRKRWSPMRTASSSGSSSSSASASEIRLQIGRPLVLNDEFSSSGLPRSACTASSS